MGRPFDDAPWPGFEEHGQQIAPTPPSGLPSPRTGSGGWPVISPSSDDQPAPRPVPPGRGRWVARAAAVAVAGLVAAVLPGFALAGPFGAVQFVMTVLGLATTAGAVTVVVRRRPGALPLPAVPAVVSLAVLAGLYVAVRFSVETEVDGLMAVLIAALAIATAVALVPPARAHVVTHPRTRRAARAGLAVATVLVLVPVITSAIPADSQPGPGPTPAPTAVGRLMPTTVQASCAGRGLDASGATITYSPADAVDGDTSTAWRCDGNGLGQTWQATYASPVTITSVGLVPGYAKVDPYDGTDRFRQSNRIVEATWTFDGNVVATQLFDTDPSSGRTMQSEPVGSIRTSTVTLRVITTVPGQTVGGHGPVDKTGTSEISIVGAR